MKAYVALCLHFNLKCEYVSVVQKNINHMPVVGRFPFQVQCENALQEFNYAYPRCCVPFLSIN